MKCKLNCYYVEMSLQLLASWFICEFPISRRRKLALSLKRLNLSRLGCRGKKGKSLTNMEIYIYNVYCLHWTMRYS